VNEDFLSKYEKAYPLLPGLAVCKQLSAKNKY
jgi:hypothetical protein